MSRGDDEIMNIIALNRQCIYAIRFPLKSIQCGMNCRTALDQTMFV
jgi:hypothetical protein